MAYYKTWRQERSGPMQGKAGHCFDSCEGPSKESRGKEADWRRKTCRKAQNARLKSLQKVVIISSTERGLQ